MPPFLVLVNARENPMQKSLLKENSVALLDDSELRALWEALVDSGVPDQDSGIAITALGIANRAAYMMQYGHHDLAGPSPSSTVMQFPNLEAASPGESRIKTFRSLEGWVQNLLYNCVTNAGTDFAPENYRELVLRWVHGERVTIEEDFQFRMAEKG